MNDATATPSPGAGVREGSPLALLQRRPWPKATSREASAGVREGSPLALLQRRPWPKATSREASGRQVGVRGNLSPDLARGNILGATVIFHIHFAAALLASPPLEEAKP